MSLSCLFPLGTTFHRFRKNPFRPCEAGRSSLLVSVAPPSLRPIQPALESAVRGPSPAVPPAARSGGAAGHAEATLVRPAQSPTRFEQVEALVVKLIALAFALACIGCGFGIQRVLYARQTAQLSRQLRQKELELRTLTQAYRALEASAIARAAEDFRRAEPGPVVARRAPSKAPAPG
jgi:hypothetical protein